MLHRSFALASIAFALSTLAAADASATAQRTFVASTGSDANPCSLALPCRAFAAAILQTASGGEVIVLDSAGYGPVVINQSVSIIAPDGIYAGISVPATQNGVVVGGAAVHVVLRGLSITGQTGSKAGISIPGLLSVVLHIERCVISKMGDTGIGIDGATGWVFISDSVIHNNNSGIGIFGGDPHVHVIDTRLTANYTGIHVAAGRVTLNRVTANENATNGLEALPNPSTNVQLAVRDSDFSGNVERGISLDASQPSSVVGATIEHSTVRRNQNDGAFVTSSSVGVAAMRVADSVLSNNTWGIRLVGDTAHLTLTGNTITGNVEPLTLTSYDPLKVLSCADNKVIGNVNPGDIPTPYPLCLR